MGEKHDRTLNTMHSLAAVYTLQGRYESAEKLYLEALEGRRQVLGEANPFTLYSMGDLAKVYWEQGRYEEAERLFQETLEAQRRNSYPAGLASTLKGLAGLYERQGRYEEAERALLEACESVRRITREESWMEGLFFGVRSALAGMYGRHGHYEKAEPLYLELEELLETRRGGPGEFNALYSLACVSALLGKREKALGYLHEYSEYRHVDKERISEDPDLASLHGDPQFEAIVAEVEPADRRGRQGSRVAQSLSVHDAPFSARVTKSCGSPLSCRENVRKIFAYELLPMLDRRGSRPNRRYLCSRTALRLAVSPLASMRKK
jgi:tetratricopeptide (TPR) repeat protein